MEIIETVIFMDGRCGKNRIKIECIYTELFEIGDFFDYTFEVAAVKIEAMGVLTIFWNGAPIGDFYCGKAVLAVFAGFNVIFRISVAETFRENLIKNGIFYPGGLFVIMHQLGMSGTVQMVFKTQHQTYTFPMASISDEKEDRSSHPSADSGTCDVRAPTFHSFDGQHPCENRWLR